VVLLYRPNMGGPGPVIVNIQQQKKRWD
jgi:hypothetical protein